MKTSDKIITRVGHAGWGDNRYFGRSVAHDLAGTTSFWSTVCVALGGRPLSDQEETALDVASVCSLANDPRIWPLKLCRIASSYGSPFVGVGVATMVFEHSPVGPRQIEPAGRFLTRFAASLNDDWSREALSVAVTQALEAGDWFAGFGVLMRARDERVKTLQSALSDRFEGRYWRLLCELDAELERRGEPTAHIAAAIAALGLDIGLSPKRMPLLGLVMFAANLISNAVEAAEQESSLYRRLDSRHIHYAGHAPRTSPRAGGRE